jgi:hypothetical protein
MRVSSNRSRGLAFLCVVVASVALHCASEEEVAARALAFVTNDLPATLEPRQIVQVAVTVRNTGTEPWTDVRLAGETLQPTDPAMRLLRGCDPTVVEPPLAQGVAVPAGTQIAPGAEYTFRFAVQAPDEEGTFLPVWRVYDAAGAFGVALTTSLRVTPVQYAQNPLVIRLDSQLVPKSDSGGGMIVHDLDGDGRMDFIVTTYEAVGAYGHDGARLWVATPGVYLADVWTSLAGGKRPGVIAADIDGDGRQEVGYLMNARVLRILDGATGVEKTRIQSGGAEAVIIANLRGLGDRDAVFQYDQTSMKAVRLDTGETLWTTNAFHGIEKRPARQADLDGDGRDELCGSNIIGPDGKLAHTWDLVRDIPGFNWHDVDSVAIGDIRPGGQLEVAIAEQGGTNEAIMFGLGGIYYWTRNQNNRCCEITHGKECIEVDPDKVALGNFAGDDGLEFIANSACGRAPWVLDPNGVIIAQWIVDQTKPAGWLVGGIEDIVAIDWFGEQYQSILAKERCVDKGCPPYGGAAVIDGMTGQFYKRFVVTGVRVHAADVSGDYREEVLVLDIDGSLKVFWNEQPAAMKRVGYWTRQLYRRQKQNWGHYTP